MKSWQWLLLSTSLLLIACAHLNNLDGVQSEFALPLNQPTEQNFISKVAPKYGVTSDEAKAFLAQAKVQPSIIKKMMRPAESKSWGDYRTLLITPKRVTAGKNFIVANQAAFNTAQEKYGVPTFMIASILGIETFYGKNIGTYRVLDALATLSFEFPKRAPFFQKELARYMCLLKKNHWNSAEMKGSYAGAFGLSQFMPSSYLNFAVSANPNQPPNLYQANDAILSVANYFKANGWTPGAPVALRVKIARNTCAQLVCNQRKPLYSVAQWKKAGVQVPSNIADDLTAEVVLLTMDDGKESWMIFHNFYVITTYNTSINYAMAAFELSKAIAVADGMR